jgi:hypothetical protein
MQIWAETSLLGAVYTSQAQWAKWQRSCFFWKEFRAKPRIHFSGMSKVCMTSLKLRNIGITARGAMTSLYTADYRETGIPAATLFDLIKGGPQ